jgi:hypothetical protein
MNIDTADPSLTLEAGRATSRVLDPIDRFSEVLACSWC